MGFHGPNCMYTNGGWLLPCTCGSSSRQANDERDTTR